MIPTGDLQRCLPKLATNLHISTLLPYVVSLLILIAVVVGLFLLDIKVVSNPAALFILAFLIEEERIIQNLRPDRVIWTENVTVSSYGWQPIFPSSDSAVRTDFLFLVKVSLQIVGGDGVVPDGIVSLVTDCDQGLDASGIDLLNLFDEMDLLSQCLEHVLFFRGVFRRRESREFEKVPQFLAGDVGVVDVFVVGRPRCHV